MDVELIATIMRLPLTGLDPTPFLDGKEKYIVLTKKLKDKYELTKETRHFFIAFINDRIVQFATKVLARKLV